MSNDFKVVLETRSEVSRKQSVTFSVEKPQNDFLIGSLVCWGYRIHQLHLWSGVIRLPTPNKCPGYDIKQSDSEALVMLELWGMLNTPSLPLLSGPP